MSGWRGAIAAGLVAALLADVYLYLTVPALRGIVSRQHWIIFLYLGAEAGAVVGGLTGTATRLWRWARSASGAGGS